MIDLNVYTAIKLIVTSFIIDWFALFYVVRCHQRWHVRMVHFE